jgi:hypothetical protein
MNATYNLSETAEDFTAIASEQAIENEENDIARAEWVAMAV